MSRRYKGAILSSTAATTSFSSASGIWTPSQQMQASAGSGWPIFSSFTGLTLTLNSTSVADNSRHAPPASVTTYTTDGSILPAGTVYSSGYFYFTLPAGAYTVVMKGAEGSGTQHGYGATINATLICTTSTRMVAIIGQAASGVYSAGGMSALAITAGGADTYSGATPVLVAGGGGGGYTNLGGQSDAGGTSWTPTTRRSNNTDCPTYGGGVYDAGAPFTDGVYTVSRTSCTTGAGVALAFTAGATGGTNNDCSSTQRGGFGGGGGSCPGGGGGYYGGTAGGNSPSQTGGGGGTSYRATSGTVYVSAWSDGALNGSSRSSSPGTAFGYLSITAA